jgi:hypothetical protein
VKPDASPPREREKVALVHSLEGRVLLEEIGDAIADDGSVHRCKKEDDAPQYSGRVVRPSMAGFRLGTDGALHRSDTT